MRGDTFSLFKFYFFHTHKDKKLLSQLVEDLESPYWQVLQSLNAFHQNSSKADKAKVLSIAVNSFSRRQLKQKGFKISNDQFCAAKRLPKYKKDQEGQPVLN